MSLFPASWTCFGVVTFTSFFQLLCILYFVPLHLCWYQMLLWKQQPCSLTKRVHTWSLHSGSLIDWVLLQGQQHSVWPHRDGKWHYWSLSSFWPTKETLNPAALDVHNVLEDCCKTCISVLILPHMMVYIAFGSEIVLVLTSFFYLLLFYLLVYF